MCRRRPYDLGVDPTRVLVLDRTAKPTPFGRRQVVDPVPVEGWPAATAAAMLGVSGRIPEDLPSVSPGRAGTSSQSP